MQTRNVIFAAVVVVVLGALLLLVLKVKEGPSKVSDDKLAQARAAHSRSGASRPTTRATPDEGADSAASSKRASKRTKSAPKDDDAVDESDVVQPKMPSVKMSGVAPAVSIKPRGDDFGSRMDEANNMYDKKDWEGAQEKAIELLKESPRSVRMMRIVVSTACHMGQQDLAAEWWAKLPDKDKLIMAKRCEQYEIEFD